MARRREISQAVNALAPIAPPEVPWTRADHARAQQAYSAIRPRLARFLAGPRRTGIAYWQWVLAEHIAGRRIPGETLETAREMVRRMGEQAEREPGEDREEEAA